MKQITIAALAVALALSLATAAPAATTTTTTVPDESTITLNASGTVTRTPDVATVQMSIESSQDTAAKATLDNNNRYNDLVGKLLAIGLPRDAAKTTSYNFNSSMDGTKKVFGVSREVSIRIENLDNVGKAIDAGTAANVTSVGNVGYGLRDPQAAYRAALGEAMIAAQANARVIADAGHVRILRIRSVSTYSNPGPVQLQTVGRVMSAAAQMKLPTEVLPSNLSLTAQVNVVFVIAP